MPSDTWGDGRDEYYQSNALRDQVEARKQAAQAQMLQEVQNRKNQSMQAYQSQIDQGLARQRMMDEMASRNRGDSLVGAGAVSGRHSAAQNQMLGGMSNVQLPAGMERYVDTNKGQGTVIGTGPFGPQSPTLDINIAPNPAATKYQEDVRAQMLAATQRAPAASSTQTGTGSRMYAQYTKSEADAEIEAANALAAANKKDIPPEQKAAFQVKARVARNQADRYKQLKEGLSAAGKIDPNNPGDEIKSEDEAVAFAKSIGADPERARGLFRSGQLK